MQKKLIFFDFASNGIFCARWYVVPSGPKKRLKSPKMAEPGDGMLKPVTFHNVTGPSNMAYIITKRFHTKIKKPGGFLNRPGKIW